MDDLAGQQLKCPTARNPEDACDGGLHDLHLAFDSVARAEKESQELCVNQQTGECHGLGVCAQEGVVDVGEHVDTELDCSAVWDRVRGIAEGRLQQPTGELQFAGVKRDSAVPEAP